MGKPYWHCSICNGNFGHGEKCDCIENFFKEESDTLYEYLRREKGMDSEQVLRELKLVKAKEEGKTYHTFEINIGVMASSCITAIEDLNERIRILQVENECLKDELAKEHQEVPIDLETLREQLRGDIRE